MQPVARRVLVRVRDWSELFEVGVAFAMVQTAIWSVGIDRVIWSLAAMFWIVGTTLIRGRSLNELGLGVKGLKQSAVVIPLGFLIAAGIVMLGRMAGTLHGLYGPAPLYLHSVGYAVWALQQQFVAQSFMFTRLERFFGSGRKAVFTVAILFAAAHIPNSFLVAVTLFGGLALSEVFRRHRNIYPLAIAHALIGLAIAVAVPDSIHHHLRVGIGYLRYGNH